MADDGFENDPNFDVDEVVGVPSHIVMAGEAGLDFGVQDAEEIHVGMDAAAEAETAQQMRAFGSSTHGMFDDVDISLVPFVGADLDDDDGEEFDDDGPSAVPVPSTAQTLNADQHLTTDGHASDASSGGGKQNALTPVRRASGSNLSASASTNPPKPVQASAEISSSKAVFHLFKGNVGAAVFSLSGAYVKSGFVVGTIIIVLLALVCVHCMTLLVKVKQKLKNPNINTYGQVACAAFGRPGKHLVDVFIVITQLGFCCVYYQFAAGLLHNLSGIPVPVWIVMMIPITTMPTYLPSMKTLILASVFASFATLLSLFVVYGYSIDKIMSEGRDSEAVPAVSPWTWPVAIGNTISAYEGIGLVLPIENSLKNKEQFTPLLSKTFFGISTLYVTFGLAGYCAYASIIKNSITDVLPDEFLSGLVRVSMAVAILLTFPLQFFPAIQVIEGWVFERKSRYQALQASVKGIPSCLGKFSLIWRNLALRTGISVALALVAALIGDQMSVFLALIGGMGGSALAVIIPPLLHLRVFVYSNESIQKGVSRLAAAKDIFLVLLGITLGCLSTYFSFVDLINKFKGDTPAPGDLGPV
eukprot:TRINITY_DN74638_c0_g1_i1.p1 TRINITY_DN74638_c0_g1~~TRINITY_DN74638_c0_g1_i1.p1  ORF type:complete len:586 (+),score=203.81 TRINITY_DN74638_c0_g1_i1:237-1994(+)